MGIHQEISLRTADVFPVVASIPPEERSDDQKYVTRLFAGYQEIE